MNEFKLRKITLQYDDGVLVEYEIQHHKSGHYGWLRTELKQERDTTRLIGTAQSLYWHETLRECVDDVLGAERMKRSEKPSELYIYLEKRRYRWKKGWWQKP